MYYEIFLKVNASLLIELNKLNLQYSKEDPISIAKFFDFEILKVANIDEAGIVKFDNKYEILKKLHSNNISENIIFRVNSYCNDLSINDCDELYAKFYATLL